VPLDKDTEIRRLERFVRRTLELPHFFGTIIIEVQDSMPLYVRRQEGMRVQDIPEDDDGVH
jgi:hypothetical protein